MYARTGNLTVPVQGPTIPVIEAVPAAGTQLDSRRPITYSIGIVTYVTCYFTEGFYLENERRHACATAEKNQG
jgi:hypothetical protein